VTTSLTQTSDNSPPFLPGDTVLRADLDAGGSALFHDLGVGRPLLYMRWMVDLSQADGGEVTIAGGIDSSRFSTWQVVLDTTSGLVKLLAGSATCTAYLPTALAWHTIEVGINSTSGSASLRLNGIVRGTLSATISATRYAWLGAAFTSASISGQIDFDRWVLSTAPIGLPLSAPQFEHGADPRRWLVVYNRDTPDSVLWADAYRERRSVPYANLCGLSLPTTEVISAAEYESLRQQISDYLSDNAMGDQVTGVLLGYGVPGYADVAAQGTLTPVASYLHTDNTHGLPVVNALYQSSIGDRPEAESFGGLRLTGRIDAVNLAEAIALIDRADAVMAQTLVHDGAADIAIDVNPDNANVGPVYTEPVMEWATGQGLARLRLPGTLFDADAPLSVSGESVLWGWRDAAPSAGFFVEPAGRRAICVQLDPEPLAAVTLRTPSATDWLTAALQAGYAAAVAPSRAYSLSSIPLPHLFFEALRLGWTIAEAWMVSMPFLRDGLQIVGDPLMTIPFPKAGYDVFGPVDRVDQIDFDQPIAVLHEGQRSFALETEDAPQPGQPKRYLVRRYDTEGRSDESVAAVYAALEAGEVVQPALPAWPGRASWRVVERGGGLILNSTWAASLRSMGVDRVLLQSQVGVEDPLSVAQQVPTQGQRKVSLTIPHPTQATRYRFRVQQGSATFDSPWSRWVSPVPAADQTIQLLEVQP